MQFEKHSNQMRERLHFCHSERSEESLFDLRPGKEREILRFAQNDKNLNLLQQPARKGGI
jgi:hypothetical protein